MLFNLEESLIFKNLSLVYKAFLPPITNGCPPVISGKNLELSSFKFLGDHAKFCLEIGSDCYIVE